MSARQPSRQPAGTGSEERKHIELASLVEFSQTLNSTLDIQTILNNLLLVPMGRLMISRAAAYLNEAGATLSLKLHKGLRDTGGMESLPLPAYKQAVVLKADKSGEIPAVFERAGLAVFVPILMEDQIIGAMFFGPKITGQPFEPGEIGFLGTVGSIAAPALHNARLFAELKNVNDTLDRKVQELHTLFEIGNEFNRDFEEQAILKHFSYSLMGQLFVNQFLVLVRTPEEGTLSIKYKKGSRFDKSIDEQISALQQEINAVEQVSDMDGLEALSPLAGQGVRLIVPMRMQQEVKGYIFVGEKLNKGGFTQSDRDFLATLANMLVASLENAQLFQEKLEKKRMEEDLALARTIQARLLPGKMPDIPGYDLHGLNIPSKQVGGDYFDIIRVKEDEYILTIADVSGKGIPAALLMSNLQAGLRMLKYESYNLTEMTARLNNLIYQNTTVEKYITFFIAHLNIRKHTLSYVNAGHNPPYLFNASGEVRELSKGGLILGMMPDLSYDYEILPLQPGDCLTMFTDGVTEAMNDQDEPFEEFRVISFFDRHRRQQPSRDINEALVKELYRFAGDPTEDDDITVLTLRRK